MVALHSASRLLNIELQCTQFVGDVMCMKRLAFRHKAMMCVTNGGATARSLDNRG